MVLCSCYVCVSRTWHHENTSKANIRLLPSPANFQYLFPLSKAVHCILALEIGNPSRRVHCYCSCTFESLVNGESPPTTPMGVCSMQHTSQGDKSYRSSVTLPGYFSSFKCKMANRQMIQVFHKKTESAFSLMACRNPMIHPIHNATPSKIFHRGFVSTAGQHCFLI